MSETVVDELVTIYSMRRSGYVSGAKEVEQTTLSLGSVIGGVQEKAELLVSGGLKGLASVVDDVAAAGTGAAGALGPLGIVLAGVVLGGVLILTEAIKTAAEVAVEATRKFVELAEKAEEAYGRVFDMKASLTVLTGSARGAAEEFERLDKVAELPGLNLDTTAKGAALLMSAGASAELAERMMREFGNAVAVAGGHVDQTNSIISAMARMLSEGVIRGRSLMLMFREMPGVSKALREAFGTANSRDIEKMAMSSQEFLAKLLPRLEAMPRAIAGPTKALELLKENSDLAWASMGEEIDKEFRPALERVTDDIESLTKSGILQEMARDIAAIFGGGGEGTADLLSTVLAASVATIETLAELAQGVTQQIKDDVKAIIGVVEAFAREFKLDSLADGLAGVAEMMTGGGISALASLQDAWQEHFDDAKGILDDAHAAKAAGSKDAKEPLKPPLTTIATHTGILVRNSEKALELQRMVLGGGNLAARGVPAADLAAMSGHSSRVRVNQIATAIMDVIQAEAADLLRRQGRLRTA